MNYKYKLKPNKPRIYTDFRILKNMIYFLIKKKN